MKSLSIALKLWLPAIAVSVGLVAMASGSAIRTVRSQAITVAEQAEQQSKLEMAARWRGLAEANALRGIGAALNADAAAGQLLLADQEATTQEMGKLQAALEKTMQSPVERAALDAVKTKAQSLQASIDKAQALKAGGDSAAVVSHIQGATP